MFKCYNGAWDDEANKLFAQQDALMAAIQKIEPEAHCTHFPYEGEFQVHVWGKELSGLRRSKIEALNEALARLNAKEIV